MSKPKETNGPEWTNPPVDAPEAKEERQDKGVIVADPELMALATIARAIEGVPVEGRKRIANYLHNRYVATTPTPQ